jgi:succinoglycan biosynthesis protein ExoA
MNDENGRLPLVTVLVPCRNEARHIRRCLDCLLKSSYPRESLELIVIDGMSTDGTREILERASRDEPFIRVLDNPRKIAPAALNIGLRNSRGALIVRVDAHSEVAPDYIPRCLALLKTTRAGNAGGRVVNVPNGDGPWARPVAFVTAHRFGVGNSAWRTSEQPGFVDTVPGGAFPRDVLDRVGWFDERLTRAQDHELNARIRKSGYRIAFDPRIRIRYYNQGTLYGLLRQGFYAGMWNVYTLVLHPYTWRWRRFIPGLFVSYLILIATTRPHAAAVLPALLYAGLVGAFAWAGRRRGGAHRVAATFASYHVCYGVGTLLGIANMMTGRWRGYLGRPLNR